MAFETVTGAGDRETRRSTMAVLEKRVNHCTESVSWSCSGEAVFYAWQRAAVGALQVF